MKRIVITVVVAAVAALGIVPATAFASSGTLYSSLAPPQGNIPSVGFEATQASEFGNEITLKHAGKITSVTVTMSSWGCQTGGWSTMNCVSAKDAEFTEPVTLNIYNAPATNPSTQPDIVGSGLPGTLIKSVTKTFTIPYRPSMSPKCATTTAYGGAGDWYDKTNHQCFAGFMTNIKFNVNATLPQTIVFGIAFNTTHYGYSPIGEGAACYTSSGGCGYDSLNVGLSLDPNNVKVGSDPYPGTVWWNTKTASYYCDGGLAGTGTFRFDSPSTPPCWGDASPYTSAPWDVPSVMFTS